MREIRTGPEAYYVARLGAGEFVIQRCRGCGRHVFHPRTVCPHCAGTSFDWVAPGGGGTVHAATTVRRKAEAGGDYNVCLVDLDEGVRMMSTVSGIAPADVRIGMRVRARVETAATGNRVVFAPLEDER